MKKVGNIAKKIKIRFGKSDRAFLENIRQLVDQKYYSGLLVFQLTGFWIRGSLLYFCSVSCPYCISVLYRAMFLKTLHIYYKCIIFNFTFHLAFYLVQHTLKKSLYLKTKNFMDSWILLILNRCFHSLLQCLHLEEITMWCLNSNLNLRKSLKKERKKKRNV